MDDSKENESPFERFRTLFSSSSLPRLPLVELEETTMNHEEQAAADEGKEKLSEDLGLFAVAELCWGGIVFRWRS